MRLIDADELVADVVARTIDENDNIDTEYYLSYKYIKEAPTIEAEPVRHGHWIEPIKEKFTYVLAGTCSVCGWESYFYEDDVVGMNYCPNCGAKMDDTEIER